MSCQLRLFAVMRSERRYLDLIFNTAFSRLALQSVNLALVTAKSAGTEHVEIFTGIQGTLL